MPCKEWQGYRDKDGYGRVRVAGKRVMAHRVAYAQARGLPLDAIAGRVIRHKCDNPSCVNPEHLEEGTHQDNMDDKVARSRQVMGAACHSAVLTTEQVAYIREVYVARHPEFGGAALGRRFGLSTVAVNKIVRGVTWK